jgi:hypothetical protein
MIQLPRRSVTRFFIPLIDVLILLFCIYLLLPIVKGPADSTEDQNPNLGLNISERQELEQLRQAAAQASPSTGVSEEERRQVERLRSERIEALQQHLAIRVLEIDADTGKLFYFDPERVEIRDEASAHVLIDRQKHEAGGRELYYLFLFPRKLTGYPEEKQIRQYERWFAGVAHGFDDPRTRR